MRYLQDTEFITLLRTVGSLLAVTVKEVYAYVKFVGYNRVQYGLLLLDWLRFLPRWNADDENSVRLSDCQTRAL